MISRYGIRLIHNKAMPPRQEVIARIGANTEKLALYTRHFLRSPNPPSTIFHPDVELLIQSGSDDVLLRVGGRTAYLRSLQMLKWSMLIWFGLWHRSLSVAVHGMPESSTCVRFKWRLEGIPRFGGHPSNTKVLLAGYSYYEFDYNNGSVRRHIVDRLVPPLKGRRWLFWYLYRLGLTAAPTKPIVGTSKLDP